MLAVFVWLLMSSVSHASPASAAKHGYQDVLLKCGQRIWPGIDWSKTEIKLYKRSGPAPKLPPGALDGSFSIYERKGKTIIAIDQDAYSADGDDMPFAIAVHELFHMLGQNFWTMKQESRAEMIPLLPQPRLQRSMLFENLQAIALGDDEGLDQASFWYDQWKATAPEEALANVDNREGTAYYVEVSARALLQLGCDASEMTLQDWKNAWILEQSSENVKGLDAEGYYLGAISGFLLDRGGSSWKDRMATGISPVEVLLETGKRIFADADPTLRQRVDGDVARANQEIESWTKPFETDLASFKFVRLVLPDTWGGQFRNYYGFLSPRLRPELDYAIFAENQKFNRDAQASDWIHMNLATMAVKDTGAQTPCGYDGVQIPVPASAVTWEKGRLTGSTDSLEFQFHGTEQLKDGLTYLCPNLD